MGASTKPKLSKLFVMLKTLAYYFFYIPFPKSMGLYHEFGYHYDERTEKFDGRAFLGIICLLGMGIGVFYGPFILKFSIIWFFIYWIIFSNFITANQFVVERYVFIPSLAYCLILSWLLFGYPIIFSFLLGAYTIRTMLHLWTFRSHEDFYLSNWLNFRKSEVSLGNLGVIYLNNGQQGKAVDTWFQATAINPFYDVPWYNLYSLFRSKGEFGQARQFLDKCVNSKILHFKDQWQKDSDDLNKLIAHKTKIDILNSEMNKAINENRFNDLDVLKQQMDELSKINPLA